jgi:hypothetical protein
MDKMKTMAVKRESMRQQSFKHAVDGTQQGNGQGAAAAPVSPARVSESGDEDAAARQRQPAAAVAAQ